VTKPYLYSPARDWRVSIVCCDAAIENLGDQPWAIGALHDVDEGTDENSIVADRIATLSSQLHTGCHLRASIPVAILRRFS
jgi:hypothetical protein